MVVDPFAARLGARGGAEGVGATEVTCEATSHSWSKSTAWNPPRRGLGEFLNMLEISSILLFWDRTSDKSCIISSDLSCGTGCVVL